MKKKIILASTSPRRREILEKMGLEFEVMTSDYEEVFESLDFSYEKIEELAYNKAKSVLNQNFSPLTTHHSLILAADTVVVLDNQILCKPKDSEDAIEMLRQLSGKRHSIVTSICMIDASTGEKKILSETSYVGFKDLSEELIKNYVKIFNPLDKAGAYGIQELPEGFVEEVKGSFENIMGLCPLIVKKLLSNY